LAAWYTDKIVVAIYSCGYYCTIFVFMQVDECIECFENDIQRNRKHKFTKYFVDCICHPWHVPNSTCSNIRHSKNYRSESFVCLSYFYWSHNIEASVW